MIRRLSYLLLVIVMLITIPVEAQTFYTPKYKKEQAKKNAKKLNKKKYRKQLKAWKFIQRKQLTKTYQCPTYS
jgi:hypothetical protein